jgi:hypothetical protein
MKTEKMDRAARARVAIRLTMTLTLALSATACGDDDAPADAGGMDAGVSDAGMPTDGGDGGGRDAGEDGGIAPCELGHLLVTTTAADFSSAGLGALAFAGGAVSVSPTPLDDTDAVPAEALCRGFVLARGRGEVRVMSAADPLSVEHVIDVDPMGTAPDALYASNPVAVVDAGMGRVYVVNQLRNALTIVDPSRDGAAAVLGEIDLSARVKSEDMDGLVDASDAIRVGDRVYVALGHYWFDAMFSMHLAGSEVVVIDVASDEIVGSIDLTGDNPWRGLYHDAPTETIWVAATGDGFAPDGRIERIGTDPLETRGDIVTEAELEAEINGFAVISATRMLVLAGTTIVAFDPAKGPSVSETVASDVDGMLVHEGTLYAFSRSLGTLGLRTFDAASGTETTPAGGPITFGELPIFQMRAVP